MSGSLLFNPIKIGKLDVSARLIKAATNEGLCSDRGFVTDELIEFHEQIAATGTPLQIVGASFFSPESKQAATKQNACDDDSKIPGMRQLAQAVHRQGGKIFGQPNHPGRQCIPKGAGVKGALAPSKVFDPTVFTMPRAMAISEIKETVKLWGLGAERYQKGDFDGIELHASQGYLISSFLTPYTNRRKDEYGGSFDNRMRFLTQVYSSIRERVGPDFPIIVKMNGHDEFGRKGLDTAELVKVAKRLEDLGVDAVEVTRGHYQSGFKGFSGNWHGFFKDNVTLGVGRNLPFLYRQGVKLTAPIIEWGLRNFIASYQEGFTSDYAAEFKKNLSIPVIATGGFNHGEAMENALTNGRCDMIGVARGFIADPMLFKKIKTHQQQSPCSYCNRCLARATIAPIACYDSKPIGRLT